MFFVGIGYFGDYDSPSPSTIPYQLPATAVHSPPTRQPHPLPQPERHSMAVACNCRGISSCVLLRIFFDKTNNISL